MENYYLGNGRRWKYINEIYNKEIADKSIHGLIDNLLVQRGFCVSEIQSFLKIGRASCRERV